MRKILSLSLLIVIGGFFLLPGRCVEKSLSSEQRIEDKALNYDPRAIVVLGYLDRRENAGSQVKWPRVACVIGDGTLILTAAHCVDDYKAAPDEPISIDMVVISPYYGDVYNFDIVAVDTVSDVAILRAHWPAHPALVLGSEEELKAAENILIASRPSVAHEEPLHLDRKLRSQLLPLLQVDEENLNSIIMLRGVGQMAPGWSGSPMLLPDSGKLVGVFGRVRAAYIKLFHLIPVNTRNDACGCSIASISKLLKKYNLEQAALASPENLEAVPDAEHGFDVAINLLEALLDHNKKDLFRIARELKQIRPESVQANLLFALGSELTLNEPNAVRSEHFEQAEASYRKALKLDPGNAHAHAAYGDFLILTKRNKEALEQCNTALSLDPNNRMALFNKLRIIPPAERKILTEQLIAIEPNNPLLWFHYGSALHSLGENEKALEAAQKTVALDPNGLFYRVLGDALVSVHREDEAEPYYKLMTERCGCQLCWYRYAQYLTRYRPEKIHEAAKALEKSEARSSMNRVSREDMNYLKLQILEKTEPNDAEALARELLEESPENGIYWFLFAGILRTQEEYDEAVEAAEKAVDLCPERSYRPRLANCLAKVGKYERAEQIYQDLHKEFPERNRYWFWYAQFLVDYLPDRIDEAQKALEKAASNPDDTWYVPPEDLKELQNRIKEIIASVPVNAD